MCAAGIGSICASSHTHTTPFGSHEIRMLAGPAADLDSAPLFWLELIDHGTKTSVDSYCCHRLKDAVPVVCDFFTQVDDSLR